ncbi:hypothetical protein K7G98_28760, partial [Saccharothrix sp. MB29]|nr:hypothetical protein [Saccharothrix sp. MB29]
MDIRTTARRTAAVIAVTAPLALMATPASAEEGAAAQDAGTTISGAGVRQVHRVVREGGLPGVPDAVAVLVEPGD